MVKEWTDEADDGGGCVDQFNLRSSVLVLVSVSYGFGFLVSYRFGLYWEIETTGFLLFGFHMSLLYWVINLDEHVYCWRFSFWFNLLGFSVLVIWWVWLLSVEDNFFFTPHGIISLGSWPTTSSTSLYGSGSSRDSRIMARIISLKLMEVGFSNKSPYLHKTTSKPMANYLIFWLMI